MARPRWSARASTALSLLAGTALLLSQLAGPAEPEATPPPQARPAAQAAETPPETPPQAAPTAALASVTLPPPPAPAAAPAEPASRAETPAPPPKSQAPASEPAQPAPAEPEPAEPAQAKPAPPPPAAKPREVAALQPDPPAPEPARELRPLTPAPERPAERPAASAAPPPAPQPQAPARPAKVVQALAPAPESRPVAPPERPRVDRPEPARKPAAERAPATAPEPARAPDPAATAEPAAEAAPVVAVSAQSSEGRRDGGVLLRLREHGSGPGVEIGWPRGASARSRLFDHMDRCLALRSAVMDGAGRLYVADPRGGTPGPRGSWRPDRDRYSGFVRQPRGYLAPAERSLRGRLAARHGLPASARVVRLFPRAVDAALLSGLSRLLGPAYRDAGRITGSYRLSGGRLAVTDLRVDGRPVAGTITLAGRC